MKISKVSQHRNVRGYDFKVKKVKVMLTRKICFFHVRLNSMNIKSIKARFGRLGRILRKTSEGALAHGRIKLEAQ